MHDILDSYSRDETARDCRLGRLTAGTIVWASST
jgi:hypothetical protein